MKKTWILFCLLSLFSLDLVARVIPRYNCILNFDQLKVNQDSINSTQARFVEIPFYEESEIKLIHDGITNDVGVKMMGRPVWRNGILSHRFFIQFFTKNHFTDKWNLLFESNIKQNKDTIKCNGHSSKTEFNLGFTTTIQLLAKEYTVENESNFSSELDFKTAGMKIQGLHVDIDTQLFIIRDKNKGEILIGKLNNQPVFVHYEINRGSANSPRDYVVTLFYTYFDANSNVTYNEEIVQELNMSKFGRFKTSVNQSNNQDHKDWNLQYEVNVTSIN